MDRKLTFVAACAMAFGIAGAAQGADFALGFKNCPAEITDDPLKTVEFDIVGTITTTNNDTIDGAQGWSISMVTENGLFKDITVEGVIVSTVFYGVKGQPPTNTNLPLDLGRAGFVVAELQGANTTPQPGAVSAIVLNQQKKQVLQPTGVADIANVKIQGNIPAEGAPSVDLRVLFKNGVAGSGEPVDNVITFNNKSIDPTFNPCVTKLTPRQPPAQAFDLAVVPEGVTKPADGDVELVRTVQPGDNLVTAMTTLTTSLLPTEPFPDGPQGWSLSIAHDQPCMSVSDVTVEGVVVRTLFYGIKGEPPTDTNRLLDLGKAGFIVTETTTTGRAGVVSAIVLNQQKKQVLIANSTDNILKTVYKVPVTVGQTTNCRTDIVDGLVGSGEPVDNVITFNNKSKVPTKKQNMVVRLTGQAEPVSANFKRGDPNNDGKMDIADAIWIVQDVALGGPDTACPDSGDANDDDALNVGDAVYIIQWQFQGSRLPPKAPFPACGKDANPSAVRCPEGTTDCPP